MKYIKQFGIIIAVSFVGELLHYLIPIPVPASIYGLVIMLILLVSGTLKVEQVKAVSSFLIEIMPMMFIPAAVGLITSWGLIRSRIVPYAAVTVVSLILVMLVSGRVTQLIIKMENKHEIH